MPPTLLLNSSATLIAPIAVNGGKFVYVPSIPWPPLNEQAPVNTLGLSASEISDVLSAKSFCHPLRASTTSVQRSSRPRTLPISSID